VVDGATWKTTLTVFVRSGRTASVDIQFFGNDGKPLTLPIVGRGPVTSVQANLGPFDSATFETEGTSATLSEGWAHVESDSEIGGVSVFRLRVPGQPDAEAAVPLTVTGASVVSSFDNTAGYLTGIALVNHGFGSVQIYLGFTAEGGESIGSRVVVLNAKNHISFLLADRFPEVAGKRGTLQVTGMTSQNTVEGSISVLGLRFNPRGSFTTLPFFVSIQR
jgi:hypothetical protein